MQLTLGNREKTNLFFNNEDIVNTLKELNFFEKSMQDNKQATFSDSILFAYLNFCTQDASVNIVQNIAPTFNTCYNQVLFVFCVCVCVLLYCSWTQTHLTSQNNTNTKARQEWINLRQRLDINNDVFNYLNNKFNA